MSKMPRKCLVGLLFALLGAVLFGAPPAAAADYPPSIAPPTGQPFPGHATGDRGVIYTQNHDYVTPDGNVSILVKVYDNYQNSFAKYHWEYTVTNHNFDPVPGSTNGFTGFETTLPAAVPDIGDIYAPDGVPGNLDGIPPWVSNGYSGLPVEWDLPNFADTVGGGTMPGQTEVFGFTTLPRLILRSTGWFHTWQNDGQTYISNYPDGDGVEVPDVISDPGHERCCYQDAAGAWICELLITGECAFNHPQGQIVVNCAECPPPVPTKGMSWGGVKGLYWQ